MKRAAKKSESPKIKHPRVSRVETLHERELSNSTVILQDAGARDADDIFAVLNAAIDNAITNQGIHTSELKKKLIIISGSSCVESRDSMASIVNILKAFGLENDPNIIHIDYEEWLNFVNDQADQKTFDSLLLISPQNRGDIAEERKGWPGAKFNMAVFQSTAPHLARQQSDDPQSGNKFDEQTGEWVAAWTRWAESGRKKDEEPKEPATGTNVYGNEQLLCDLEDSKSLVVVSTNTCRKMRFSVEHLKSLSNFPELIDPLLQNGFTQIISRAAPQKPFAEKLLLTTNYQTTGELYNLICKKDIDKIEIPEPGSLYYAMAKAYTDQLSTRTNNEGARNNLCRMIIAQEEIFPGLWSTRTELIIDMLPDQITQFEGQVQKYKDAIAQIEDPNAAVPIPPCYDLKAYATLNEAKRQLSPLETPMESTATTYSLTTDITEKDTNSIANEFITKVYIRKDTTNSTQEEIGIGLSSSSSAGTSFFSSSSEFSPDQFKPRSVTGLTCPPPSPTENDECRNEKPFEQQEEKGSLKVPFNL